jgi:hypothetical protein
VRRQGGVAFRRIPVDEDEPPFYAELSDDLVDNQEAYLQRRGLYPSYDDLDLADDYAENENETQHLDFNRSPPTSRLLARSIFLALRTTRRTSATP